MHWMIRKIRAHFAIVISSVLFIFLLALCLLLIYTQSAAQIIQKQTDQTHSLSIQGLANVENELFGALERMKSIEGRDTLEKLIRLGADSTPLERTAPLYMLKQQLSELYTVSGRQALGDVMIVFDAPTPYAVSTLSTIEDLPQSMAFHSFVYGDYDVDSFMDLLRQRCTSRLLSQPLISSAPVQIGTHQLDDCFAYVYRPLQLNKTCDVYVLVFLNQARIASELSPEGWPIELNINWSGWEDIASGTATQPSVVMRQNSVTYIKGVSHCFGLSYTLSLEDSIILSRVHSFKMVIFILIAISLILAVLMCILSIWSSVHPMDVVRNALSSQSVHPGSPPLSLPYQVVAEQIRLLASQNRKNAQQLQEYESMHVCSILERMFSAIPISTQEKEVIASFLTTAPSDHVFRPVIIPLSRSTLSSAEERDLVRRLRDVFCVRWGAPALFVLKKKNYLAFLCAFTSFESETNLAFTLSDTLSVPGWDEMLSACIGPMIHCCEDVTSSFQETRKRFHEMTRRTTPKSAYTPEALLPYREISRLYHLLLANNEAGACELLLQALERANHAPEAALRSSAYAYIASDICHLCERALIACGQERLCDVIYEKQNVCVHSQDFEPLCDLLCFTAQACTCEKEPPQEDPLAAAIMEYVNAHYSDNLLSLAVLAKEFHMSEKYFSAFFKSKTDVNFSVYLENIRLLHAQEMLLTKKFSVAHIAMSVGYSSPNTFYKAFKRYAGVTPSQWQQLQQSSAG